MTKETVTWEQIRLVARALLIVAEPSESEELKDALTIADRIANGGVDGVRDE